MLRKWFESNDDNFLAQVKDPVQRKKRLRTLARSRVGSVASIAFFGLIAILEFLTADDRAWALPFCVLVVAVAYTTDLQIKMSRLISSMQQERDDNDSPAAG